VGRNHTNGTEDSLFQDVLPRAKNCKPVENCSPDLGCIVKSCQASKPLFKRHGLKCLYVQLYQRTWVTSPDVFIEVNYPKKTRVRCLSMRSRLSRMWWNTYACEPTQTVTVKPERDAYRRSPTLTEWSIIERIRLAKDRSSHAGQAGAVSSKRQLDIAQGRVAFKQFGNFITT